MKRARQLLPILFLAASLAPLSDACAASAAAAPEKEGRSQKRITSSEDYIPVGPLTGALTANYQVKGLIVVDSGLNISDPALRAQAQQWMPRVKDSLRTAISEYVAKRYHIGAAPDADRLSVMMQNATDRALGRKGASLLLSSIMVQDGR